MGKEEDKGGKCPPHNWRLVERGNDYTVWKCKECPKQVWHDKQAPPPKDKNDGKTK